MQFPQLREHFFSVIHVIGRNGSETQYAQYQPYPENGVVYLDALKSFENPCQFENFTDLRDLEIHIQLPCAGNQTDQTEFLSLFTIFPLNFSDCHRDKATKLFYSLAKVDEKHHAFLPKVDFSDYKSKINLSEYPIENRPIVRISHWSSECEVKCSDSLSPRDVIVKNAQCGAMERTGDETKVCDFSSNESCNWEFVAAGGYKFEIKEENFTSHSGWLMERMAIVSGLPRSPVDPPMIVSPYFVHTAATCLMEVQYVL
ncbi:unnamed protein product, partial [Mesorhabditis belari]|uniref:Uncharacterized protein n=1 Tax=Mesorhabditis belari TaxID=2138241 RepID=A0AAF3J1T4_9BILA